MTLWTIGHSTRSLAELVVLLQEYHIALLADIRSFPRSARHPHFAKENLEQRLPEAGIEYRWLGKELGGYRKKSNPQSPHVALRNGGFRNYADHMASEDFRRGIAQLETWAAEKRVAIMCAEQLWWRCHRSLVSDYWTACRNFDVIHIIAEGKAEPHRLHRAARLRDGRLVYDVGEQGMLCLGTSA